MRCGTEELREVLLDGSADETDGFRDVLCWVRRLHFVNCDNFPLCERYREDLLAQVVHVDGVAVFLTAQSRRESDHSVLAAGQQVVMLFEVSFDAAEERRRSFVYGSDCLQVCITRSSPPIISSSPPKGAFSRM